MSVLFFKSKKCSTRTLANQGHHFPDRVPPSTATDKGSDTSREQEGRITCISPKSSHKPTGILAPVVGESASVSAQSQIWLVQEHSFPNRITIAEVCQRQQQQRTREYRKEGEHASPPHRRTTHAPSPPSQHQELALSQVHTSLFLSFDAQSVYDLVSRSSLGLFLACQKIRFRENAFAF